LTGALRAVHLLLVQTRFAAASGADPQRLARILDVTEYLVALLLRDPLDVTTYRRHLEDLEARFPELKALVAVFDETNVAALEEGSTS
jgi:hypothetical protein